MTNEFAFLDLYQNRDAFERLVDLVRNGAITPFVGAGLSCPCGFPSWGQFLDELAQRLPIATEVRTLIASGEYLEAADRLEFALTENGLRFRLQARFGRVASIQASLSGALLSLPTLTRGPVLTTNFDQLLERAYLAAGAPFERVEWGWKPGILRQAMVERRHILVKLHGDAEDEGNRVFTRREYIRHYGQLGNTTFDPTLPLPLTIARAGMGPLLFLGCSLISDRILEVLTTVATEPLAATHYAILEAPVDETCIATRTSTLATYGIRPLWYPNGRHDLIELMLRELHRRTTGGSRSPWPFAATVAGLIVAGIAAAASQVSSNTCIFVPNYIVRTVAEKEYQPTVLESASACDPAHFFCISLSGSGRFPLPPNGVLLGHRPSTLPMLMIPEGGPSDAADAGTFSEPAMLRLSFGQRIRGAEALCESTPTLLRRYAPDGGFVECNNRKAIQCDFVNGLRRCSVSNDSC